MDLFRRHQKKVFWIVTIIIVPSFVLVWGVGGMGQTERMTNFEVGAVDGKSINYTDFENFQKRLRAALGGVPLQFAGAPGAGTPAEELYKFLYTYQVLKDAERAGVQASDLQVGTYLENGHPVIAPAVSKDGIQARDPAIDAWCRQMQISRADFVRGIREWQTIGNYLDADANLSAVNDESTFAIYALNRSEIVVKRIRFLENDSVKERAKAEIMARPADELTQAARDYALAHADNPRYREPAKWRFAWILTPFVPADSVRQPTDAEIRERYDQNRDYVYEGAPLADVQDRIRAELLQEEVERQTLRNFKVDVDSQLLGQANEMALPELVKLAQLVKYGVSAGDTGEELLTSTEVATKLPQGGDFQIQLLLDGIDGADLAARESIVSEWKTGFNLSGNPFKGENGFYRLRLLDYVSSIPAELDAADGSLRPEIYERAIEDMVGERAGEIAREDAITMDGQIRAYLEAKAAGEPAPDEELAASFEQMPTETIPYLRLVDSDYELSNLPVGDIRGPTPYRDPVNGDVGQELVVVVDRLVPSREDFAKESDTSKATFRNIARSNYRGNYGFTYTMNGPVATIQPSPAIMGDLFDRYIKGQIRVNPELIRTGGEG